MKLESHVLFVSDIETSKDFYTNVTGMEVQHDFGTNVALEGGLALWQITEGHPILVTLNPKSKGIRTEVYFESEEIQNEFDKLKNYGIDFFQDLHEEA